MYICVLYFTAIVPVPQLVLQTVKYSGSQKKLASLRESHAQMNANAKMFSIFAISCIQC